MSNIEFTPPALWNPEAFSIMVIVLGIGITLMASLLLSFMIRDWIERKVNPNAAMEVTRSHIWAKLQGGYDITPEEQQIVRLTDEQLKEQYRRFGNPNWKKMSGLTAEQVHEWLSKPSAVSEALRQLSESPDKDL